MTPPSFEEFFVHIWAHDPFPWQTEYARRAADGELPDAIDIPTGAGKTAVVDAHVWAAGTTATAVRLFVLADRRVLVDQIADRAHQIRDALVAAGPNTPLGQVRAGLLARSAPLSDDPAEALGVHSLRGGDAFDTGWVSRPDQVAIISTTVDQLGSTALHRPYLMSPRTAPMAAAMLCDSVVVVDEAQLARPLIQSLRTLPDLWDRRQHHDWGQAPKIIASTATHQDEHRDTLELTDRDHQHPELRKRIHAAKHVHYQPAHTNTTKAIDAANADRSPAAGDCVLIVVNTVDTAVAVHQHLTARHPGSTTVRLTGRQRPSDRDRAVDALAPFLSGNHRHTGSDEPTFVVATQAIECGVDLDADLLITETCPRSALIQRLGRLNRTGRHDDAHAIVIPTKTSPYGTTFDKAAAATYLDTLHEPIDANPINAHDALAKIPELDDDTFTPTVVATLIDTWSTNLPDHACAPLDPYLRGLPTPSDHTIHVLWRKPLICTGEDLAWWEQVLRLDPPTTDELCPTTVNAARTFLDGRPYLRVRHNTEPTVETRPPRPGDIVAIPADYGGVDRYGWTGLQARTDPDHVDLSGTTIDPLDPDAATAVITPIAIPDLTTPATAEDDTILHGFTLQRATTTSAIEQGDDDRSLTSMAVTLDGHQRDVAERTSELAGAIGIPADLAHQLRTGAAHHDHGKTDPRFQAFLGGTDTKILAKSDRRPNAPTDRRRWAAAGLPPGWRHEAASVQHLTESAHTSSPLAVWVAGTHHGHGRPIWPITTGADIPPLQTAHDDSWHELHHQLRETYGPWRLALLETIVRAADWNRSAHPQSP